MRLTPHGVQLLAPIPPMQTQTLDLERLAYAAPKTLSRHSAPGPAADVYSWGPRSTTG